MTKWQNNLMAKKWTREKLSSAISNVDFFAMLFFCQPLGCPPWAEWPLDLARLSWFASSSFECQRFQVVSSFGFGTIG
jgi:hypothetical protein